MSDICKFCNFDNAYESRILDKHEDMFGVLGNHEQVIYMSTVNKEYRPSIRIEDEFKIDDTITTSYGKNVYISYCPFCGRKLV